MSKWIPVQRRLPALTAAQNKPNAFGRKVLVYHQGDVMEAYYGRRITSEPWFYLSGAVLNGVTHWMPLPEPPKRNETIP